MSRKKRRKKDKIEENSKITLISFIEDHLGLLTAASSLLGLIVTGLFKCFPYFYEKGYYLFWNIPLKYMKIDYTNTLMQFFLNIAGFILIIGIALLYMEFYNSSKIIGRIFLHLILFFINTIIWVYAIISVGGKFADAMDFTNGETIHYFIVIMVFLFILEIPAIHVFKKKKPKKEKVNEINLPKGITHKNSKTNIDPLDNQSVNRDKKSNKINGTNKLLKNGLGIYLIIVIAYFVGVIWYTCITLSNDRKDACKETTKFEIVNDEFNQKYIILSPYEGLFFVKPCTVYEEKHFIAINSDKYKLLDIKGLEVVIYNFSNYKEVFQQYCNDDYNIVIKNNVK